ncbi:MAG TPA: bifunctional glycosyltransferase family 2 protein/CDP-glycerol:glycerophosphate glycerophosphotransferase [Micromonosporaceae bacterium]|nr:bifunctional glycosyltransferase family 2 protein/CDP-glycerol:glycerophosphate glycerophosphotransferase [Micromonosporaceae bacterium]
MPLLSVVLPVYGVAGYLRECLDSMTTQSFEDFEIIAVDDRSPDNSGAILDEYARRDPRIKVFHLPENVGLGPARDAGLPYATGTYVWFVDSDDIIAEGAFRAIARILRETSPDVLMIDHAKIWMSGRAKQSSLRSRLFRDEWEDADGTPLVFSAAQRPEVLRALHTAWSRIMRRQFLLNLGVTYTSRWYEDVSYIYPVTAAAQRISVLFRVCYLYRQGRHGSITGAQGHDRHFEIFDEYDRVFATMDRLCVTDAGIRDAMFTRMLWHVRWVLNESGRVPRRRRREFFTRLSVMYREHKPEGYLAPSPLERFKQRMVAADAWLPFLVAHTGKSRAGRFSRRARKAVRRSRRLLHAAGRHGWDLAMAAYYRLMRMFPLDDDLALYAAYWYRGFQCNPAAIYRQARTMAPDVHGVFVVGAEHADAMPAGVDYVVARSMRYYRLLAQARYLVNNVNFPDHYRKRAGSVFMQTHHGTPLKVMGMDHYRYPLGARNDDLPALLARSDNWDISLSTSPFNSEVWQRSYPCEHETLEIGYPRNDRLAVAIPADIAAARASLGIREAETAVLFAPTHREYQTGYQPLLDVEEFAEALGPDHRLLLRTHYFYDKVRRATGGAHPAVLDVSAHPDVETLYLAADVLITDYSSAMFDYAYLDRPIVIFAPDWDTYRRTRGVTFDLLAEPPGAVAGTYRDLVEAFAAGEVGGEAATMARKVFREKFCPHADGRSSEKAVRRLFLGEPVA